MRIASPRQLALICALCLATAPLRAQLQPVPDQQPESALTVDHFDAVVVSSLDGKPVARVLVTSPDRRMAAITDFQGRFSFDFRRPASQSETHVFASFPPSPVASTSASAPTIQFNLRRPSYVTGNVTLHLPAVSTDTPAPPLQLKIVPAATLTGHLDPESGDLPEHFSVMLRRKQIQDGAAVWNLVVGAPVNRRGEFRFANLEPGDYKLQAPASGSQFRFPQVRDRSPDSVPGFLPAFYSNADTIAAATSIHLGPGDTATANLTFRNTTFYRVTIPVAGMPDSALLEVHLLFDIPGLYIGRNPNTNSATGYLPNGDYDLMLVANVPVSGPANAMPVSLSAPLHLHVSGRPVQLDPVALHPPLELPVIVRRELTNPPPDPGSPRSPQQASVFVNLQSLDPNMGSPQTAGRDDSDLRIGNLTPGVFRVNVAPRMGYAAAVTSGATDLLREPLRVASGSAPQPIEVTLRDDFASLTIHVATGDPAPAPTADDGEVFLLIVPLDRPESQSFVVSWQDTTQNQYTLPGLPPGRYLALASHSRFVQNVEFRNEDVLRDLVNKGAVVTLSPGQKADVQVPLLPEETN